jgi:hypothetical protein
MTRKYFMHLQSNRHQSKTESSDDTYTFWAILKETLFYMWTEAEFTIFLS